MCSQAVPFRFLDPTRFRMDYGVVVPDDAIIRGIRALARHPGVFAEPAGAAVLTGLRSAMDAGMVDPGECIVLLVTGSGLKNVAAAAIGCRAPVTRRVGT